MSSEKDTNTNPPPPQPSQPDNYYQRKKNIISGIDNDHLNFLLNGIAITIGAIALYPTAKNAWDNFINRPPQLPPNPPLPPPVEDIIPPTPPNGHANPEPPVPVEQPVPEPKEEEEDGLFHETELRRRQKLMGQRPKGSRYDSPFGKDIGGL